MHIPTIQWLNDVAIKYVCEANEKKTEEENTMKAKRSVCI